MKINITKLWFNVFCMLIVLCYSNVAQGKTSLNDIISGYTQYLENNNVSSSKNTNVVTSSIRGESLPSGSASLTKEEAKRVTVDILASHRKIALQRYGNEWASRQLSYGGYTMPFSIQVFGKAPSSGRSLYISLHGGGGTTAAENTQQWENQKRLYSLKEGIYFVPRSPTDTWNMWHQAYMDGFIQKTIELATINEGVNPNKVYIMGYSAGGDGVYQLATRMPDLFAAAAMSAGHPGDAHIENLYNLPFGLYMGGKDSAYDRNTLAVQWKNKLTTLAKKTGAYIHDVHIFPEFGHWMQKKDAMSIPWMSQYMRDPIPYEVLWIQDDVVRKHFYWLSAVSKNKYKDAVINVWYNDDESVFYIEDKTNVKSFIININDAMCNLDKKIKIYRKDTIIFDGIIPRYKENIKKDVTDGRDMYLIFPAKILIDGMKAKILGA